MPCAGPREHRRRLDRDAAGPPLFGKRAGALCFRGAVTERQGFRHNTDALRLARAVRGPLRRTLKAAQSHQSAFGLPSQPWSEADSIPFKPLQSLHNSNRVVPVPETTGFCLDFR